MKRVLFAVAAFAAVFAAGAADMITAREATNIAEAVVARMARQVDGAERPLPKFLHVIDFDSSYPDEAEAYYRRADGPFGGCSVRRVGNVCERNYDWNFDESAEFVVRVSAAEGRFASIGLATVGTNLTDESVTSGRWSPFYKVLPGRTLDGINENGVFCEVNVVATNGSPWETEREGRDINSMGAVRWVLDHATDARSAADALAARAYLSPAMRAMGYSVHYAVCDATGTYVVEDGVVDHWTPDVPVVMTNFRVFKYHQPDPYGTGYERFDILADLSQPITNAWFSKAYAADLPRLTEFAAPGVGTHTQTNALRAWAEAHVVPNLPPKRDGRWWQTVHTSVYDLEAMTVRVAVQETDDWYVFRLDDSGSRFRKVVAKVLAEVARASGVEARIIEEINALKAFDIRVMDELPESGEAGVVYLVKAEDYAETKTRDEYLWSQGTWRLIGSTRFDSDLIAKTVTTEPIPPDLTNRVGYVNSKTYEGETRDEDENGAVVIGKGAVGTPSKEYVRSLTNATGKVVLRSTSVAIGANARARDENGRRAQSIAIGWNSKASAVNSIAIGSGAVHWHETDETGPAAVASASESIAIGYDSKARASQSVQIGRGVNDEAKSLKFYDTFVVKDGKVQGGGTNTNDVRDISREETRNALEPSVLCELSEEVTVRSHAMTTYAPTNGTPEELLVSATASRNFEVFLPNTPEMRSGLPVSFTTEIEGEVTRLGPWWTNKVLRLPAKLTMKEPLPKTLILEVEEYATEWDWTPVVTRAYETNGWVRIEGTNLHFAAAARIGGARLAVRNPLYGVVNLPTNGVSGVVGALVGKDGDEIASFVVE